MTKDRTKPIYTNRVDGSIFVPWVPLILDRANGCEGAYAIARMRPDGVREYWNVNTNSWTCFAHGVLTYREVLEIMKTLTFAPTQIEPSFDGL